MKTWVIIPVVAMAIVGLLALFGAQWFFLNTFGPKGRSLRLELPDRKVLLCEEKTSAEVAGMHYEVDFRLIDKLDTLLLGHAVFADHDWDKSITLFSTGHWHILPVRENSFLRLLLVNKKTRIRRDTTLTPEAMRRQVFASAGNLEPVYSGRSNLTRFSGIDFIVVYEYRVGDYLSSAYRRDAIEHRIDSTTGRVTAQRIHNALPDEF